MANLRTSAPESSATKSPAEASRTNGNDLARPDLSYSHGNDDDCSRKEESVSEANYVPFIESHHRARRRRSSAMRVLLLLCWMLFFFSLDLAPRILPIDRGGFMLCAEATTARYRGSVYRGVTNQNLNGYAHTFNVRVSVPAFPSNITQLKHIMVDVLSSNVRTIDERGVIVNSTTFWVASPFVGGSGRDPLLDWRQTVADLMEKSTVTVKDEGRTALVQFSAERWHLQDHFALLVVPCLPFSLFTQVGDVGVQDMPNNCLAGDPFLIRQRALLQVDAERWTAQVGALVTGNPIDVPLVAASTRLQDKFTLEQSLLIVEGYTCLHTREATVRGSMLNMQTGVFRFVPHRGGVHTLCYIPYPDTLPLLRVKMMDSFEIAGPEGVSTDPALVRAELEFTGTIYGTHLSERDTAVITDELCSDFTSQNVFFLELFFSSPSRVSFFGTFHKRGIYHVCYHHERSTSFVRVSTLLVEKGNEVVIESENANVLIDQDIKLLQSASVSRLKVQNKGNLNLKGRSLNISYFVWSGGSISGHGIINCQGYSKITTIGYETRVLSVPLYNYGEMTIDVQRLTLDREGAIHNYGNLTLAVSSMGADSISSALSHTRRNTINNYAGGILRVIALDERSYALLTCRLLLTGGTAMISGRLNLTDVTNGVHSTVILKRGAVLTTYNARLSGNITLEDRAVLTAMEGSVFASSTISGTGSLLVGGDGILLDSLAVVGSITTFVRNVLAPDAITMSIYGTVFFGPHTLVKIGKVHFVTSTGVSTLLFDGILISKLGGVQFVGNTIFRLGGTGVIYHDSNTLQVIPPSASFHEASQFAFIVATNATIFFLGAQPTAMTAIPTADAALHTNDTSLSSSLSSSAVRCSVFSPLSHHLTLNGRMVLSGCGAVSFHSSFSGTIEGLVQPEDWEFLRHVLCREDHARLFHLCQGAPYPFPIHAGLLVNREVHALHPARVKLDELLFAAKSKVRFADYILVEAKDQVVIRAGAALNVAGGAVIQTPVLHVKGVLIIGSPDRTLIKGSAVVGASGIIRLQNMRQSPCDSRLRISGNLSSETEDRTNIIRCEYQPTPTAANAQGSMPADIFCPAKLMNEMDEKRRFFLKYWIKEPYNPPPGVPSVRSMVLATLCSVACTAFVFYILLRLWGSSCRQWYDDFRAPSPLQLTLTWYEFSYSTLNYLSFCALALGNVQSAMASFHPGMPAPLTLAAVLCLRSMNLLMPHHHLYSESQIHFLCVWVLLWSGVQLLLRADHLSTRKHTSKNWYYVVDTVRRVSTMVTIFMSMFLAPMLSFLLDGVACATFLQTLPTCKPFAGTGNLILSTAAFVACGVFIPWSITQIQMQFLHMDVRMKVSHIFLSMTMSSIEISMWKVFYSHPVLLVVSSTVFQLARFFIGYVAPPTAYDNVNAFVQHVCALPLLIYFTLLVHAFRVHVRWIRSCSDGDRWFKAVFALCIVGLFSSFWRNILYVRSDRAETTGDVNIDAIKRSVAQIRSRIHDMKVEVFSSTDQNERENTLNAIARLRIEFLEKQERYRYETHRILRPFYLGKDFAEFSRSSRHNALFSLHDMEERLSPASSPLSLTPTSNPHAGLLTVEEMESFNCGPALGKGSYGTVHLGILTSGRLVAVKYVNVASESREALQSVMAEVNVLRELSHPNIIRYYGAHTIQDTMLVFMEFAVGGSLTSIVRRFKKLTEPVMVLYTYQILRGLQYLHCKGVVHRDIKGENILIDGYGVAKLADFGCSKELANIANASQAGCATLVGSPFWMAPEVIRSEAYGTKADIWSIGCTVVEMLNDGEPPWRSEFENVYSAMFYVGSTNNIPQIPDDTSDLCRDFLSCCFERDVAKRASADELLQHAWLSSAAAAQRYDSLHPDVSSPLLSSGAVESPQTRRNAEHVFPRFRDSTEDSMTETPTGGNDSAVQTAHEQSNGSISRHSTRESIAYMSEASQTDFGDDIGDINSPASPLGVVSGKVLVTPLSAVDDDPCNTTAFAATHVEPQADRTNAHHVARAETEEKPATPIGGDAGNGSAQANEAAEFSGSAVQNGTSSCGRKPQSAAADTDTDLH